MRNVRFSVFVEDNLFAVDGGNFEGTTAGGIGGASLRLLLLVGVFGLPIEDIGHVYGGDCIVS